MNNISLKAAEHLDGAATTIITTVIGSIIFALFLVYRDDKPLAIALLIGAILAILALMFHFMSFITAHENARRADALVARKKNGKNDSPKIESKMHFYGILTKVLNRVTHSLIGILFVFIITMLVIIIVKIGGS